jgi:hypothetical protein
LGDLKTESNILGEPDHYGIGKEVRSITSGDNIFVYNFISRYPEGFAQKPGRSRPGFAARCEAGLRPAGNAPEI